MTCCDLLKYLGYQCIHIITISYTSILYKLAFCLFNGSCKILVPVLYVFNLDHSEVLLCEHKFMLSPNTTNAFLISYIKENDLYLKLDENHVLVDTHLAD